MYYNFLCQLIFCSLSIREKEPFSQQLLASEQVQLVGGSRVYCQAYHPLARVLDEKLHGCLAGFAIAGGYG